MKPRSTFSTCNNDMSKVQLLSRLTSPTCVSCRTNPFLNTAIHCSDKGNIRLSSNCLCEPNLGPSIKVKAKPTSNDTICHREDTHNNVHEDLDKDCNNPNFDTAATVAQRIGSSATTVCNNSLTTPTSNINSIYETAHLTLQRKDLEAGKISTSERFLDQRIHRSSSQCHGCPTSTSPNANSMLEKLFARSLRTRTLTTFHRSAQGLGELSGGSTSGTNTTVIVDHSKGQPRFVHRVTVEILPNYVSSKCSTATNSRIKPITIVTEPCQKMLHGVGDSETGSCKALPKLTAEGRADSLKTERRGRSLFRKHGKHKRSCARSPGFRRLSENQLVGAGTTSGINASLARIGLIRRESPSPQPGGRKRTWTRKVMSRADRDRMSTMRGNGATRCESSTAIPQ